MSIGISQIYRVSAICLVGSVSDGVHCTQSPSLPFGDFGSSQRCAFTFTYSFFHPLSLSAIARSLCAFFCHIIIIHLCCNDILRMRSVHSTAHLAALLAMAMYSLMSRERINVRVPFLLSPYSIFLWVYNFCLAFSSTSIDIYGSQCIRKDKYD